MWYKYITMNGNIDLNNVRGIRLWQKRKRLKKKSS